jgi:hypothetical protein
MVVGMSWDSVGKPTPKDAEYPYAETEKRVEI